jgi:hypothetical protein
MRLVYAISTRGESGGDRDRRAGVVRSRPSIRFTTVPVEDSQTRLVYFAEALGTFGTGYLLPVPSRSELFL